MDGRRGGTLREGAGHSIIDLNQLPEAVQAKILDKDLTKIAYDQPVDKGVTYVSRNHPLTIALAEYLFNVALQPDGDRNVGARCGIIRSKDVGSLTTLMLLRLRFLVADNRYDSPSIAEECLVSGFTGNIGSETWLSNEEAENLFEQVEPSMNLSDTDKKHWVNTILKDFDNLKQKIKKLAENRANDLMQSYGRLRKTIKVGQVSVEPLFPADVLSLSIIVPQPGTR